MMRYCLSIVLLVLISSCETKVVINEKKINESGEKLQKTVEKGADTLVSKVKRLTNDKDTTNP